MPSQDIILNKPQQLFVIPLDSTLLYNVRAAKHKAAEIVGSQTMTGEGSTTCSGMCTLSNCMADTCLYLAFQLSVCIAKRAHSYNDFIKA